MISITENLQFSKEFFLGDSFFRNIIETAQDVIMVINLDLKIQYINRVVEGFDKETVIGTSVFHYTSAGHKKIIEDAYSKVAETLQPVVLEIQSYGNNLGIAWYSVQISPILHNGSHVAYSVITRDVTAQKIATDELIKSETQYRSLVEQASDGIAVSDESGKLLQVNSSLCNMLGYTEQELLQLSNQDLVDEKEHISQKKGMEVLNAGGKVLSERKLKTKVGKIVESEISAVKLSDNRIQAIIRDISERKNVEEKNIQLLDVLQRSLNEIYIFDALTLKFEYLNNGALKNLGYTAEEVVNFTPLDLKPEFTEQSFREQIQPLLKFEKDKLIFFTKHRRKDGTLYPVEVHLQLIEHRKNRVFLAVILDITERKKVEDELLKKDEQLRKIFDTTQDVICLVTVLPGGIYRCEAINKAFTQISGIDVNDLIGKTLNEEHGITSFIASQLDKAVQSKIHLQWEQEIEFPVGTLTAIVTAMPMINADGTCNQLVVSSHNITQRKQAEKALIASEKKYRTIMEHSSDAIYLYDDKGTLLEMNKMAEEITGFSNEELRIQWAQQFALPENREYMKMNWERAKRGEIIFSQRKMTAKNGSILHLEVSSRMITENLFQTLIRDVTIKTLAEEKQKKQIEQLKQYQDLLRNTNHRYKTILDTGPECIKLLDHKYRLLEMNYAGLNMLEAEDLQQVKGVDVTSVILPEFRSQFRNLVDNVFLGIPGKMEFKIKGLNGTEKWLETHSVPLKNEKGEVEYLLGVTRDITENKFAADKLLSEKEVLDSVINSLPGFFFLFTDSGKFLRWNKHLETASGYSSEEIGNMLPLDFVAPYDAGRVAGMIIEGLEKGSYSIEADLKTKSGKYISYFASGKSIIINGKKCLVGIGIDISSRKAKEKEILHINKQLRKLSAHLQHIREEERRQISIDIHDELGQQLTALKFDVFAYSKKVSEHPEQSRTMKKIVTRIDEAVATLRRMASDLRPSILDDFGLVAALEWLGDDISERTGIKVNFHTNIKKTVPPDISIVLFRIYQEALTNAMKHSGAQNIFTTLELKGEKIVFEVSDNGKGFSTTTFSGVGLIGIKERVLSLKGSCTIESVPGKGATINIKIPMKQ